jgi:hypothetical protein
MAFKKFLDKLVCIALLFLFIQKLPAQTAIVYHDAREFYSWARALKMRHFTSDCLCDTKTW